VIDASFLQSVYKWGEPDVSLKEEQNIGVGQRYQVVAKSRIHAAAIK